MRIECDNKWQEAVWTLIIVGIIGLFWVRRLTLCVVGVHSWHSPERDDTWCFFCEKPRKKP